MIKALVACGLSRRAAATLIANVGTAGLRDLTVDQLIAAGAPRATATRVHAAMSLSSRACERHRVTTNTAEDIAAHFRAKIGMPMQEVFVVVCLNVRNEIIDTIEVGRGTVHSVEVHPREVFRGAIRCAAAGIILAHNHPSGDPTPSPEDIMLTKRLKECGELLGIHVVDHVVVADYRHRSITEWMS